MTLRPRGLQSGSVIFFVFLLVFFCLSKIEMIINVALKLRFAELSNWNGVSVCGDCYILAL